jgi:hypothetical protein
VPINPAEGRLSAGSSLTQSGSKRPRPAASLCAQSGLPRLERSSVLSLEGIEGVGSDFNDVIKFTTYLVHSQDIAQFMELRSALFPKLFNGPLYPPNTLLVVDRLVQEEFLLEVEAVVRGRKA